MRRWMALVVVCALAGTGRAGTALEAAVTGYATARAARDAGRFVEAVDLYLAEVDRLVPLTVIRAAGPVSMRGTSRTNRVARWYLQKIGHDLAGIYLWRPVVLPGRVCDRLATALHYSRESAFQARAGGFPLLPQDNDTQRNIAHTLDALATLACAVPDEEGNGATLNVLFDHISSTGAGDDGISTGPTFAAGNIFRGVCAATTETRGSESRPVVVAPVTTQSAAEMEPFVRAHAGRMPRDAWDQEYITG